MIALEKLDITFKRKEIKPLADGLFPGLITTITDRLADNDPDTDGDWSTEWVPFFDLGFVEVFAKILLLADEMDLKWDIMNFEPSHIGTGYIAIFCEETIAGGDLVVMDVIVNDEAKITHFRIGEEMA